MLVVKIELWPFGRQEDAREIGRAYIWNRGGTIERGNYGVAICGDAGERAWDQQHPAAPFGPERYWAKHGGLSAFPRGPKNLWPLILAALQSCRLRKSRPKPLSHGHQEAA